MKAPEINYEALEVGDVVFTGGRGIFARLIRRITAKGKTTKTAATHVGIIVDFNGQKLVAEMLAKGLSISSLEEYRKSPRRFILEIGRIRGLSENTRERIGARIAYDRRQTIEYDWKGIFQFLGIGSEDPERLYCSEYVAKLLVKFVGIRIERGPLGGISPEDVLQYFENTATNCFFVDYIRKQA